MTIHVDQTKSSHDQLMAEILRLRRENTNLKSKGTGLKVSEKGAVSLYGLGRFPVTLYDGQWAKLFDMVDEIKAFIAANKAQLRQKEAGA